MGDTEDHSAEKEREWKAGRFRLRKSTAYRINSSRGRTMKIDELADAIEDGERAGCGLDVFEVEPLPSDHRLWGLENVILTPHIAVRDAENLPERRYQVILENARRFLAGEPLMNIVDKENWY